MKAPAFSYQRPDELQEALDLLADSDGNTQILAGGQSLLATLNMRLSSPAVLVDINRIAELRGIAAKDRTIRIGALVRHAEVLESELIAREVPLLAMALPYVAHMAIRNRGTTCGSLALADPSAEMPALAVTLNADIVLQKNGARRSIAARDFFEGLYQTARGDDEMITEVIFPVASEDDIFGFTELSRRHGDFATVGIALRAKRSPNELRDFSVVVFGSEPAPLLSSAAARMQIGRDTTEKELAELSAAIAAEMQPMDNQQGRAETKRKQATALLRRALGDLQQRAFSEKYPS